MAITIQKSKINGAPVIFGADADTAKGVEVKFGYGTLENVLAKIGTADDGVIYFGYDEAKSTGAIVSRGKLVSSKILDITTTPVVTGEGGKVTQEAKIVISYIDTDKTVKTLEIPVSADGKLKELADNINALKTLVGTKADTKETDTVFGAIAKEADRATTKETAISDLLGTKDDDKTKETAFGKVAFEVDRAVTAETGLSNRIKTLENKKYTTVTPKADGHVKVAVSADNVVTVTEDDIASAALLGTANDVSTANTAFGKIAAEADRATKAEGSLNTRVTSIETLITSDKDGTINKVSEVIDWFNGVEEGEGGAKLLADVAANKAAIGTEKTTDKPGTGIYKRIEDLEAKKHTVSDVTATTGKYVSGVKVDDTGALTIKETELTAAGVAATAIGAGDETVAVEGYKVSTQIASLAKSIKAAAKTADDAIKALDVTDTAVDGQYVSAVSETDGKITVTRADLPTLSVKTGSEQFAAVNNHEVEIKTTALNTVGLTKTEAGKWQAGTADVASTGLATAADVAAEIVSDEEVIATALNDHENRLKTVEGKEITVSSAKSDVGISVAEVKDSNNVVTTAATNFNVTNGKVTFTIHNGDKAVAETITAYTEDTVKALVELYAKEKARAEAAEAKLDVRLSWIEVGTK
ncbi:MAG: hypothetical protein [Vetruanivirus porcinsecundi]|uniref:Tail fiber protein n=1 Tax=phage Lak_Megaphage_RVC_AP3_GC26 TaxID=3109225 RepID=A0ABZ0Z376_9CAUD|nr:MAG: hypothetical protein [phage Lak_Megaphage_RVC_AP3_GC26]